jgi:hypothetical protein
MSEGQDIERFGGRSAPEASAAANPHRDHGPPKDTAATFFDRSELNAILRVYGRKVAEGEWRDYAIDQLRESVVFSIFRRSSEMPLYRIVKQPKLARKQGAYSVVATGGLILKRGHDLAQVLRILDKDLKLVRA